MEMQELPKKEYSLIVHFDTGERKKYELPGRLTGFFLMLKDTQGFKTVFLDEYGNIAWDTEPAIPSTICRNNGIDLCKDAVCFDSVPYPGDR